LRNPAGHSFGYFAAGRLTDGWAAGHHYGYGYGPTTGCTADSAGADSDRTTATDDGAAGAGYCYDQADRLISTTDPRVSSGACPAGGTAQVCYDNHGNVVRLGGQTFGYDAADRNVSLSTPTVPNPTTVAYQRDGTDRIVERDETGYQPIGLRGVSSASSAAAVSSLAVAVPAGAQPGDVLVGQLVAPVKATVTAPAGWVPAATVSGPAGGVTVSVFTHLVAAGDPAGVSFTVKGAAVVLSVGVGDYTGVDTAVPVNVTAAAAPAGTGTVFTAPAVRTDRSGTEVLALWGFTPASAAAVSAGPVLRWQVSSTAGAGDVTAVGADQPVPGAGAAPSVTATTTTPVSAAVLTVALNPAYATTVVRYGYTGDGDTADLTLTGTNTVTGRTIGLLGGVLVSKRGSPAVDVWSYPNLHGDTVATTDGTGAVTGVYGYDPFGGPLGVIPDNSAGDLDYGWLGKDQRGTDTTLAGLGIIEMGARLYAPLLGRFLQTDPVPGGSANDYDYCNGDPINCTDLNGKWPHIHWRRVGHLIGRHWRGLAQIAVAGACVFTGAVTCAAISLSVAFVSSAYRSRGSWHFHGRGFAIDAAFAIAGGSGGRRWEHSLRSIYGREIPRVVRRVVGFVTTGYSSSGDFVTRRYAGLE
jgi:RHS repeat-associated protein